jgi:hypothetical protein
MTIEQALARLRESPHFEAVLSEAEFRGEKSLSVKIESLSGLCKFCRDELGFDYLIDIASIDHFGDYPRFEIVYELSSLAGGIHLRIKALVPDEDNPVAPTRFLVSIAGICNERRNVVGLMPHPERACEIAVGSADGRIIFESVLAARAAGALTAAGSASAATSHWLPLEPFYGPLAESAKGFCRAQLPGSGSRAVQGVLVSISIWRSQSIPKAC